jgi:transcriptional regulator GlxA family with amidase domain
MDDRIHKAQNYILNNLDQHYNVDDIAQEVGMSGRNLNRLFKKTTKITIGTYRENLRIERALKLLSENNTLATVAEACGLKSISHLRSLLKKHKNILPSQVYQ